MLTTADGGASWLTKPQDELSDLVCVCFTGEGRIGWVGGHLNKQSLLLKTTDHGETWNSVSDRFENAGCIDAISFLDETNGWLVSEGGALLHTSDGGETWRQQKLTDRRLWAVDFEGKNRAWVVGDDAEIWTTHNAGDTWARQSAGAITAPLHDVSFIDEHTGWIVGDEVILKTTDGGDHWLQEELPTQSTLRSLKMHNREEGLAIGEHPGVILRRNGQGWHVVSME